MSRKQDPLSIEFLLLGIIRKAPIHTYDLNKLIAGDEEIRTVWHFNQSQLYALLDKIEKNGLIESEIAVGSAFPFRKVYSITSSGETAFTEWLITPVEHSYKLRSDFLAKLYFLKDSQKEQLNTLINNQLVFCSKWREKADSWKNGETSDSQFLHMVGDYRKSIIDASEEWLKKIQNGYFD